jgi:DNA-binding MarR family transcriptional regulator
VTLSSARTDAHVSLDEALVDLRRLWMHPRLLRWFADQVGHDVEPATLRTLRAIEAAEGGSPGIKDLAAILAVDASTASRLAEQAVGDGYVERRSSEADRRRTELRLTAEGEQLLTRSTQVRGRMLGRATRGWDDEELTQLAELLARLQVDLRGLLDDEECP